MSILYKVSNKDILQKKNKIFLERGLPALTKNGFKKSPFSTSNYGRNNLNDFTYELCRLSKNSKLECITTHIVRDDKWIQVYLNIFQLKPHIDSLEQLNGLDGIQFHLVPNKNTALRLRIDDFNGMPMFRIINYKIGFYYSNKSLNNRIKELERLIERDLDNIDYFINRWYEIHKTPLATDWEGHPIK